MLLNESLEELNKFLDFMNSIDPSGKIKFAMPVANESVLDFFYLNFHIYKQSETYVDVYAKATNSFTYVLSSTCYLEINLNNTLKSIQVKNLTCVMIKIEIT